MKCLFFTMSIVLSLFSCDLIPPDTTVINNSSHIVFFQYSNTNINIETLSPGASVSTKYSYSSIIIKQPEKRVTQNSNSGSGPIIISDIPSWEVYVENKTENPITLTANGWMDEIIVPAGEFIDDTNHKGKVYTKNPFFETKSDTFPLDVQWQFNEDIFYIVIRN